MEALEFFAAERDLKPALRATRADAGRTAPIVARGLPLRTGRLPDRKTVIPWMMGRDLRSARRVLVPQEAVSLDSRQRRRSGFGYFLSTSTGLAAHPDPHEAELHAICEVIERDAFALWSLRPPAVQARSRRDLSDELAGMSGIPIRLAKSRIVPALFEITSDIHVPAFVCYLDDRRCPEHHRVGWIYGLGCHPDRAIAAKQAVLEALQSRVTMIAGAREDIEPWAHAMLEIAAMMPLDPTPRRVDRPPDRKRASSARRKRMPSPEAARNRVLDELARTGHRRIVTVDLSLPDLPIWIVKILIPGLEGPHHRIDHAFGARARRMGA